MNSDDFTRRYFDSLLIEMRLIDSDLADPKMKFLGETFDTPIMLGTIGHYGKISEDAVADTAIAARDCGTVLWLSEMEGTESFRKAIDTGAKVIKIIKPHRDQDMWLKKAKEAEEEGAFAVASDIDHAFSQDGKYDGKIQQFGPKTSSELKEMTSSLGIPFIAKGVLSVRDAVKCMEAGVRGIVVSHHKGIMNYAVPPCLMLPDIKKTVGSEMEIVADCGISCGADAFKTLACGAGSVCIARAFMQPLKDAGSKGVSELIRKMTGELAGYMSRTSSEDIYHIDPAVLHKIDF